MTVDPALVAVILYALACVLLWGRRRSMTPGWCLLGAAALLHLLAAVGGWLSHGIPPAAGARGFLLVMSWLTVVLSVAMFPGGRGKERFAGSASALAVVLVGSAATLPVKVGGFPPALRSPWFPVHVSLTAAGEAAIGVAFLAAMLGLMGRGRTKGKRGALLLFCVTGALLAGSFVQSTVFRAGAYTGVSGPHLRTRAALGVVACGGPVLLALWLASGRLAPRAPKEADLLELQLRSVRLGFALFTIGAIGAGMAWARAAWGSWWSWDPKEVASLIVWLMLAIHIHLGPRIGWRATGNRALLLLTFLACLANLIGTFTLGGLHGYG
jgi:ABC-type transport system involved in cytochrome c biogenesis permease subunit